MAIAPRPGPATAEKSVRPDPPYAQLLRLRELLAAARTDTDPAMSLFLITHQSCELAFAQIVDRTSRARDALRARDARYAADMVRPLPALMRGLSAQFDVLFSLTREQFEGIRVQVGTASGIQSAQWRLAEYTCGLRDERHLNTPGFSPAERHTLRRELDRSPLAAEFRTYACDPEVRRDAERTEQAERIRGLLVSFDIAVTRWRAGHIEIARHFIGGRPGTAGTSGERYLNGAASSCLIPGLHHHPDLSPHHLQGAT